jgi:NAD kinase
MVQKEIKNILVVFKDKLTERIPDLKKRLELALKGRKHSVIDFNKLKKEDLSNVDLVITVGGDGTFVKAANWIEDSLIIGINSHPETSEGFLTGLNIDQIDLLERIFEGKFSIIKMDRIKAILNGKVLPELAINEVFLGAITQFHTSRYVISYKGKEEEHRSSGVIVCAGTGSTAWYKSAGGKPFKYDEKKLAFIVREPYIGDRLFKSKILSGNLPQGEKLIIKSKRTDGQVLAINDVIYDFNIGSIAEIELSDKPLNFISFS